MHTALVYLKKFTYLEILNLNSIVLEQQNDLSGYINEFGKYFNNIDRPREKILILWIFYLRWTLAKKPRCKRIDNVRSDKTIRDTNFAFS